MAFNSTKTGSTFNLIAIQQVWEKASPVMDFDAGLVRKDRCGAWIHRTAYGQTTNFGWEIDHMKPKSADGGDELSNLQPLHWNNNRAKSDDWPAAAANYCVVRAAR